MSRSCTKILHEAEGQPTILEVPLGYSAIVFTPTGDLDLALIPDADLLPRDEQGEPLADQGTLEVAALIVAMQDPEVRALVERKINQPMAQA